jgi:hypothetical protein
MVWENDHAEEAKDNLGWNHACNLWFAKTLAEFEINDIAALPPVFCYNS